MEFWIFIIFNKTFLEQSIYANVWVDVIASQFSINFVHRNEKNPIFQLWESKTCYIFTLNKCRIMFALIWGYAFTYLSKIWTILMTHLHIPIDSSRNVHWKFQSVISSLFFIRFTSNCSKCLLFLLN